MTAQWDEQSGIRERLALLAALYGFAKPRHLSVKPDSFARFRYDPSHDRWEASPWGDAACSRECDGTCAIAYVAVSAEASVQLDRLRKLGITYHEAMQLIGYPYESEEP